MTDEEPDNQVVSVTLVETTCHCGNQEIVDTANPGEWECPQCGCIWGWRDDGEIRKIRDCGSITGTGGGR